MRLFNRNFVAPVAIVTASALTLAACSDSSNSSSADNTAAEETVEVEEETTTEEAAAEYDLPGKPADFEVTPPNSELSFGETANVVMEDSLGTALTYAKITVEEGKEYTHEQAQENAGQQFEAEEGLDSYVCFDVKINIVHVEQIDPAADYVRVGRPSFGAEGTNGNRANSFFMGSDEICGVDQNATIPTYQEDVNPDRDYQDAVLSWKATSGGIDPEAVSMTYEVESVPELDRSEKIRWS